MADTAQQGFDLARPEIGVGEGQGALVAQPGQPAPATETPVYERWWFWTAIGVVVAGGVVAALLLSGGGTTKPPCTATVCL